MSMAYTAAAGVVVGIASSVLGGKAAAKQADRIRAGEIAGAKSDYAATESSVNIMKGVNRENSENLIREIARAGAAQSQEVKDEVRNVTSTALAQSEGLTSGRSKGRQMVELQVKGAKAIQDSAAQTTSMINQVTDQMDAKTNSLNNKLINSWQNMATVLSTPGATYQQNPMEVVQAGMSGAQAGASLGKTGAAIYNG